MIDQRKEQLLITLIKMIGLSDVLDNSEKGLVNFLKTKYPKVKEEDFNKIIAENGITLYKNGLLNIFDEQLTEQDVEKVIEFYSTEVGKKMRDKNIDQKVKRLQVTWMSDLEKKLIDLNI